MFIIGVTMKNKKVRKFKYTKLLKALLLLLIFGMVYSFSFSVYETIHTHILIQNFKNRGTRLEQYDNTFYIDDIQIERHFYSVSRETSSEKDNRNVIHNLEDHNQVNFLPNLAYKGDIFVARQSPFPRTPIIHEFITLFYGGHAAIYDGDGDVIEAYGFPDYPAQILDFIKHDNDEPNPYPGIGVGKHSYKYWFTPTKSTSQTSFNAYYNLYYKSNFQILRVKQNQTPLTEDTINQVVEYADYLADESYIYNFLFFLDMKNKYYCTDLISRAYDYVLSDTNQNYYAKSLNDDGFITTVNDIILSRDTYLALHFEVEKVDEAHYIEKYYFLEQV